MWPPSSKKNALTSKKPSGPENHFGGWHQTKVSAVRHPSQMGFSIHKQIGKFRYKLMGFRLLSSSIIFACEWVKVSCASSATVRNLKKVLNKLFATKFTAYVATKAKVITLQAYENI